MSSEPYWPPSLYDLGYSIKVSVFCPMLLPNLFLPPFESEIEYSIRTMIPDIKSQLVFYSPSSGLYTQARANCNRLGRPLNIGECDPRRGSPAPPGIYYYYHLAMGIAGWAQLNNVTEHSHSRIAINAHRLCHS